MLWSVNIVICFWKATWKMQKSIWRKNIQSIGKQKHIKKWRLFEESFKKMFWRRKRYSKTRNKLEGIVLVRRGRTWKSRANIGSYKSYKKLALSIEFVEDFRFKTPIVFLWWLVGYLYPVMLVLSILWFGHQDIM